MCLADGRDVARNLGGITVTQEFGRGTLAGTSYEWEISNITAIKPVVMFVFVSEKILDKHIDEYAKILLSLKKIGGQRATPIEQLVASNFPEKADRERQNQNYERAILFYSKALEIKPWEYGYIWRGRAYAGNRQFDKAIADYTKVIESAEGVGDKRVYLYRANAYRAIGKIALAEADERKFGELRIRNSQD